MKTTTIGTCARCAGPVIGEWKNCAQCDIALGHRFAGIPCPVCNGTHPDRDCPPLCRFGQGADTIDYNPDPSVSRPAVFVCGAILGVALTLFAQAFLF